MSQARKGKSKLGPATESHAAVSGKPRRSRLTAALLNLVLLGSSCVVFVVLGELTLRAFPQLLTEEAALRVHWAAILKDERERGTKMVVADPEIGFLYRPNTTSTIDRGDIHFTFTTDDHGFRNNSPWPPKVGIVVLGDSMVFGYGLKRDQSWTSLVAKALPDTSILNLGMTGAAPQQYLHIYQRFGVPEHPRLVILMLFTGNDVQDAQVFQTWADSPRKDSFIDWRMNGGEDEGSTFSLRSILSHSYLFAVLREAVKDIRNPDFAGETLSFKGGGKLELAPGIAERLAKALDPSNRYFRLTVDTVAKVRDIAREQGSGFLVLLMPTKEHVYLPLAHKPVPPETEPFANAFGKLGISYLDLTEPLRAAASTEGSKPLYFDIDGHPNAQGSKVIAEAVTAYLQAHELRQIEGENGS